MSGIAANTDEYMYVSSYPCSDAHKHALIQANTSQRVFVLFNVSLFYSMYHASNFELYHILTCTYVIAGINSTELINAVTTEGDG